MLTASWHRSACRHAATSSLPARSNCTPSSATRAEAEGAGGAARAGRRAAGAPTRPAMCRQRTRTCSWDTGSNKHTPTPPCSGPCWSTFCIGARCVCARCHRASAPGAANAVGCHSQKTEASGQRAASAGSQKGNHAAAPPSSCAASTVVGSAEGSAPAAAAAEAAAAAAVVAVAVVVSAAHGGAAAPTPPVPPPRARGRRPSGPARPSVRSHLWSRPRQVVGKAHSSFGSCFSHRGCSSSRRLRTGIIHRGGN
mmetsp:Transcript_147067/g.472294  ORF Transcript_147067/g.472294 Transcript_147067/m.472294 type:complete len:254 (-) Transcript_147067:2953-3714(-)